MNKKIFFYDAITPIHHTWDKKLIDAFVIHPYDKINIRK